MSTAKHHVVCEDPAGTYLAGSIVEVGDALAIRANGVITIPVDADAVTHGGPLAGMFLRHWGGGWPLAGQLPQLRCPMAIQVVPELRELHWAAKVARDTNYTEPVAWPGLLQLAQTPPLVGSALGVTGSSTCRALPSEEVQGGGWIVGGDLSISCSGDGYAAFALYGVAPGYVVLWAALSVL